MADINQLQQQLEQLKIQLSFLNSTNDRQGAQEVANQIQQLRQQIYLQQARS